MSFLFSGIETGVLSLNRLRLRQQMREGQKNAKILACLDVAVGLTTIAKKRNYIRSNFNKQFIERQSRFLFSKNSTNNLKDSLLLEFGWSLDLPWGWEIVKKVPDSNFVWLGKEMPFQWIGIGWSKGNLVESELSVGSYLWEWPKNNYRTIQFSDYKFDLKKADKS